MRTISQIHDQANDQAQLPISLIVQSLDLDMIRAQRGSHVHCGRYLYAGITVGKINDRHWIIASTLSTGDQSDVWLMPIDLDDPDTYRNSQPYHVDILAEYGHLDPEVARTICQSHEAWRGRRIRLHEQRLRERIDDWVRLHHPETATA